MFLLSLTKRWWASITILLFFCTLDAHSWGFAAHRYINESAVYALPSPLREFFEYHRSTLKERAVAADQRRSWDPLEASCHFMDMDRWNDSERWTLPLHWDSAVQCYTEKHLRSRGILPWHAPQVYRRLVWAFEQGNHGLILRTAADLGHYLADAHVPLHLCSNYNGQNSGQHGLHALLESRIPEYLGDTMVQTLRRAEIVKHPARQIWQIMNDAYLHLESVFDCECLCRSEVPLDLHYAPFRRGNRLLRQESIPFVQCYHRCLGGLMGRQLAASVAHVADWWLSAWVEAGQPLLRSPWGPDARVLEDNNQEDNNQEDNDVGWKGAGDDDHSP